MIRFSGESDYQRRVEACPGGGQGDPSAAAARGRGGELRLVRAFSKLWRHSARSRSRSPTVAASVGGGAGKVSATVTSSWGLDIPQSRNDGKMPLLHFSSTACGRRVCHGRRASRLRREANGERHAWLARASKNAARCSVGVVLFRALLHLLPAFFGLLYAYFRHFR